MPVRKALGGAVLIMLAVLGLGPSAQASSPIQHVVVIFQENHSFNDVLGKFCVEVASGQITRDGVNGHCAGRTTGVLSSGQTITLSHEPDRVPNAVHGVGVQKTAIDGGAMDGFDKISTCSQSTGYACYTQYFPGDIPNLTALATHYALSDHTFEFTTSPSWGGHFALAAATLDGFRGENPHPGTSGHTGPGWGCDSFRDGAWWNGTSYVAEPSCVPDQQGNGPYRTSPVPYTPTIFDRLVAAGDSFKVYNGGISSTGALDGGYAWAICPTFYSCLGHANEHSNLVPAADVLSDAANGTLPDLSIVTPSGKTSQHNHMSMTVGDNWIGQVMSALQASPEWSSMAVFVTYDDCGCFYDFMPPPSANDGIRVPMVIASPFAKAGYTDSNNATFSSILAFVEHAFGLQPLSSSDANAYDYSNAFDYSQTPLAPSFHAVRDSIPPTERAYIRAHPGPHEAT